MEGDRDLEDIYDEDPCKHISVTLEDGELFCDDCGEVLED